MERAAAVVLGGIGLVLLTLAAVVLGGPDQARVDGRVELAAVADRPLVTAPLIPDTAPSPTTTAAPATTTPTADQPPAARAAAPPQPIPAELVALTHEISNGGVRFVFGRADLDAQATALLDRLVPLLRGRPDVILLVRGHTDSVGPDEVNRTLSGARAIAVVQYLMAGGVDPAQLQMVGLAADQPLADNATTDGRQLNRRSDLLVEGQR
ncbi:MAG: OmpA-OmpF porin, family [Acidimicrobiia bacterium]|jgi:outer membrane protein OmpA-like peptidoglycan-associated protein|nr:OmpA-OmpF porin, family [Acidimicrobiia bacterium]